MEDEEQRDVQSAYFPLNKKVREKECQLLHAHLNQTRRIAVVVVTHNSEVFLEKCLANLFAHYPAEAMEVVVVDSASTNMKYLSEAQAHYPQILVLRESENVGYCRGNNIGYHVTQETHSDFVLFLNPDAFITGTLLPRLLSRMAAPEWADVAVCTPRLMGYSLVDDKPTGRIDSAGIGMSAYGRFFDRGQGSDNVASYSTSGEVAAVCGAFMFCRRTALEAVSPNREVFDERFYMYKEDLDLSLRLRQAGMRLMYCHDLVAYHCRGWRGSRLQMPSWAIMQSLRNDWLVWSKFWLFLFPNSLVSCFYLLAKSLIVAAELWILRGLLRKGRK